MTAAGSYLFIVTVIVPHVIVSLFSRTGNLPHILARTWARFTLLCANVRVEVRGSENITQGPAIYMPNHVSHFDVFALLGYLKVQFRWIAKIVPITVIGSRDVLPKHGKRVKPGKIILNIGKPIEPHGHDVNSLMEEVYNSINLGYTL
jgi:1-acyl-sn-glycerol-3-phosphate acyltransferase